uniref:Coiled-coil domain containing 102B n=1 Tax=Strigops habroptila TaxID=2489341 RepID=A0A672U5M2_STRHB
MNLGSVQKLMEEMQVFETQPRQPYELAGGCQPGGHLCNSNLPSQSFYPYSSHYPYMHTNYNSDWEISETVKIQELEDVKARAAQMEKTMRWWSDCTANWREKWSKVRGERNKAREEARQLRIKLDNVVKELSMLKKINQDLISEKKNLGNVTAWKTDFCCSEMSYIKKDINHFTFLEQERVNELSKINKIPGTEDTKKVKNGELNDLIHVSVLHLQLAEMQKILQKEREMNVFLEKEMEKIENELYLWKWRYEELHQTKLEIHINLNLKETGKSSARIMERKICEIKGNFPHLFERLQFENTSGWGKKEKLEAEKQSLEEENRSSKSQVKEIQGLLEMKNKATLTKLSCDHQNAQSKVLIQTKVYALLSLVTWGAFP